MKLYKICDYVSERVAASTLSEYNYISTENMLPNKGGITKSSNIPSGNVIAYSNEDVLISNIRPYFKKIWQANIDGGCSADVLCVRAKETIYPRYLYYLLSQDSFFEYVMAGSKGCKMPRGDKQQIMQWDVKIPEIGEQIRIAEFLSSIDSKIELNRRINENLEQQAQALFKSWFVDFEPFKDDKFVDSELGRIPEGWKVKKFGELCDSISVTHPCKKGQLIFLNTGDIENGFVLNHKYMNIKDMPGQAKKSIQENDILYSEIRPINRHFAFVNFPAQEYIVSTKLMVLRANDNESSIRLYQYLTSEDVINELQHEAESRSGTFPQIRFENIKSLKILIGSDDVEKQYTKYIENIYKMIFQYRKEIIRLEQLRDTLLPRLMSGELEIKDNSYD
ncbi:MAG TPA: restriction endonuclease subunit S [Candidatus Parabacteroides intestinipullorum]|uniref:Restriction endonuclease subunit S n=1 Tax=Candidatus Parabacteroides intestinipullorum TaxID=2838723 RepID=A0A9D1X9H6_9BACT|nr:restriction endonuclease subunit S [Candidatus Parabacteroides intestinipullorum]